jgi:phosphatidylglycerophosphatase C
MKKRLVLFDFDGTITTRDSFLEFLLFYSGKVKFFLGMLVLSPVIALYVLKLIPNWKGKQIVLRWFWEALTLNNSIAAAGILPDTSFHESSAHRHSPPLWNT